REKGQPPPQNYPKKKVVYGSFPPGLRKKPLRWVFVCGGKEREPPPHDTIPKKKRFIGRFHLVYGKNRFGGFLFWGGKKGE
ncbi:hypothetical protein ACRCEU_05545, partial [Escherichia coli]|uniref:hypothetical protein n=1 Tax=Escherichia coli TaxID=562 RepID=UPI003D8BC509